MRIREFVIGDLGMDVQKREAKIELYGKGYDLLIDMLKDIPQEMWKFKPEPKEWSVHEILVHLADSESNAALRARKLIVEPGGLLMGYDQDKWTVELDYHDQSYEDSEYDEPYTFEKWLDIYSGHIPGHIEQIKNNYKIWRDQQG